MASDPIYVVPPASWNGTWLPDAASVAALCSLQAGATVAVVKWGPDGTESTRYPARVVRSVAPQPWIEVEATWTLHRVEEAGLAFEPGDTLCEFFSAEHPFNAMAVISPEGNLRGWYGNVTYPAFVIAGSDPVTLVWHDLFLDVVILPDGTTHLLDDDELAAAGMVVCHPALAAAIEQARRDLIATIPTLISSTSMPSLQSSF